MEISRSGCGAILKKVAPQRVIPRLGCMASCRTRDSDDGFGRGPGFGGNGTGDRFFMADTVGPQVPSGCVMDEVLWALHYSFVASAIEFIRMNAKQQPTLGSVAEAVQMRPFHFQRVFSEWAGMSPKRSLLATISAFEPRLQRPRRSDPDQRRNPLDLV